MTPAGQALWAFDPWAIKEPSPEIPTRESPDFLCVSGLFSGLAALDWTGGFRLRLLILVFGPDVDSIS